MRGADASKQNRRVHLTILPGTRPGTMILRLTSREPDPAGAMAALISRGMLMGDTLDIEVVTDASKDPSLRGLDGKSAYQLARESGYGGTLAGWLVSLVGADGKSAYDIARELGYGGTKTQWLATLVGAAGKDGRDGTNGLNGKDAASLLGSVVLTESNLLNVSPDPAGAASSPPVSTCRPVRRSCSCRRRRLRSATSSKPPGRPRRPSRAS